MKELAKEIIRHQLRDVISDVDVEDFPEAADFTQAQWDALEDAVNDAAEVALDALD